MKKFYYFFWCILFNIGVCFAEDTNVPSKVVTEPQTDVVTDPELAEFQQLLSEAGWQDSDNENRRAFYERVNELMEGISSTTDELRQNYEDLRANEQSLANRTLTATTIAATGLGGMELAEGLAAKKADEAADRDMTAYLETFRCTYGDGKQVKGGQTPVELPGGNNAELMKLRNEYVALAKDLKERKNSLGMQAGIESEEILDKAEMGLYDDENVGVTGGSYASLYRAKALGSEEDQKKLDEATKKAGDKIKGGAIAAGIGTVVGIAGNAIINKNAPKDRSEEILSKRDSLKSELRDFIQTEISNCNEEIKRAKDIAVKIKSKNIQAKGNPDKQELLDFVSEVESLPLLSEDADITKFKEHPICK